MSKAKTMIGGCFNFYKQYQFLINLIILSLCFLANCFLPFFTFVAFGFCLLFMIFSDVKTCISYSFFVFSFQSLYMPYSAIMYGVCAGFALLRLLISKFKEDKNNFKLSLTTIILFAVFIIYLLLPINKSLNARHFLKMAYICFVPLLIFVLTKFSDEFNFGYNLKCFLSGLIVACYLSLLTPFSNHLQTAFLDWGLRYSAFFLNPNMLAFFCVVSMSIMLYYVVINKYKFTDLVTFFLFFLIGFFSLSKTFLILSSINLLILFIFMIKQKSSLISICSLSFVVILGIVACVFPQGVGSYLGRFQFFDKPIISGPIINEPTEDNPTGKPEINKPNEDKDELLNKITTNRFDLWIAYTKDMVENPINVIFGKGLGVERLSNASSPHNILVSSTYQLGLVGLIIYISIIAFAIRDGAVNNKKPISFAILIPCITIFMVSMIEDLIFFIF